MLKSRVYVPKEYNLVEIRRLNVTSMAQKYYDLMLEFNVEPKINIDPMLYAIELSYRNKNRYGAARLPNIKGNMLSGRFYGSLLPPYFNSTTCPEWTVENQRNAAKEMLEYLVYKSIKPETVLKWQKEETKCQKT